MKNRKFLTGIFTASLMLVMLFSACSDEWLETKPLSFYTPENTYVDADGFYAALTACERNARHEFFGDGAPMLTEMIQADICAEGTTDKTGPQMNMDVALLPDAKLNDLNTTQVGWYWKEGYSGIKYANIVISRIDNAKFNSEAERNAVLGAAYFQRAYRYYKLTHQFGNVPWLDKEIQEPKLDFYTNDRWDILEQLEQDLEFAYKWVPDNVDRGRTSKGGCGALLMKVCMANRHFDRAIEVGKEIVAAHPLMKERFTKQTNGNNLMFDLHSIEAKLDMSNTEGLYYVVSYPEVEGSDRIRIMRNCVPFWNSGNIRTPGGNSATVQTAENMPDSLDNNKNYGRGIGRARSTWYLQSEIWTDKEKNDIRGTNNRESWRGTWEMKFNNPVLKEKEPEWYGKNLQKPPAMGVEDTIRTWYQFPQYKTFVPDPLNTQWQGGETPWYVYRSAEVYLMMAECYYWLDRPGDAAAMMNEVRERAGADPLTASDITIGEILNERARELYYEENRHVEIVRMAYTFAVTGRPCEVFGGRVYNMENFSGPKFTSVDGYVKEFGYNFWYDWVYTHNDFYRKQAVHNWAQYKISVHHVLWPIPANAINDNTKGIINQNIGYPGDDKNITPLHIGEEYGG